VNEINLTGPTNVDWMTPEKLQAMTDYERAEWATKNLSSVNKFKLVAALIKQLQDREEEQ
jgi:hypothetical protein